MSKKHDFKPNILGFLCNWCSYAGADLCGVSRLQYPPEIKFVRVMCSGRVDLSFIFRAFLNGKDGVFIGGCWPGDCHYVTEGNYHAISKIHLCERLLAMIGVNPERVRLEWVSASEGVRFAKVMHEFSRKIKALGPVGTGENIARDTLKLNLEIIQNLVPYIKLVEREKLRVPVRSVEAHTEFLNNDTFDRLFEELIASKFEMDQMLAVLREKPCSTREVAKILGITSVDALKRLHLAAKEGFCAYDENEWLLAAA